MGLTVKMQGFEDLDDKLHNLVREKGEAILRKGLRAGGEIIQQTVIDMAPVRVDVRDTVNPKNPAWSLPTGALKSDIGLRVGWDKKTGGLTAFIGPGKYSRNVAEWVEFGHAIVRGGRFMNWGRRGKGQQVGRVKAHPFLRPALDLSEDEAIAAFKAVVVSEVEKHMKGQ
jgi:Bacteriophage HK97-gp10, putative tail-component